MQKEFKMKIKEARISKGLNQTELANLLDTNQRLISRYELGTVIPSLERLVKLAQILDVSLDDLVEFKRIQNKLSEELNKK